MTAVFQQLKFRLLKSSIGPVLRQYYRALRGKKRLSRNDLYDEQTFEIIRRVVKPNSNCVDVGAHKGRILLEICRCAPQAEHLAIEPLPHLAEDLRKNFPKVSVLQIATGDTERKAEFCHVKNQEAFSGLRRREYQIEQPIIERFEIEVKPIDAVVPVERDITLIKIDVEGGEYHTLLGAAETIRRCKPLVIFESNLSSSLEYGFSFSDLHQLLHDSYGYSVSTLEHWLSNEKSLEKEQFEQLWTSGSECMYIAYPTI